MLHAGLEVAEPGDRRGQTDERLAPRGVHGEGLPITVLGAGWILDGFEAPPG